MIRKTLALIVTILLMTIQYASANSDWYKYPVFSDCIDDVVETSNKVFYLSGGNLYSFSPNDQEIYSYSPLNVLHDKDITKIYYNAEKDYLLVIYENSNMDIIQKDGKIINLPEIKDSSVASSKTINDVAFGVDRIAIATDFGIVIYSDERNEVIESGIFNKKIDCIAIMDNKLLIFAQKATNNKILYSPIDTRHNNLDKFTELIGFGAKSFKAVGGNVLAVRENSTNRLVVRKVNFENPGWTDLIQEKYEYDYPIKATKDGFYTLSADKIIIIQGENVTTSNIPESLRGEVLGYYSSPTQVWVGNQNGVAQFDISTSSPTLLYDRMIYPDYTTDQRVGYMKWSPDGQRLYISNRENSIYYKYALNEGSSNYQTTNILDHGTIIDASLMDATATHKYSTMYQAEYNNKRMYGDPSDIIQDPDDKNRYYCGNYFEGVYVLQYNEETGRYDEIGLFNSDNSTIADNWGERVMYLDIDKQGNLWVGHQFGSVISILPASKRRQDPSTITASDWVTHNSLDKLDYQNKDFKGLLCKKSNMFFYSMALYDKGFVAIDTQGTYDDPSDDKIYQWVRVTDQDGNEIGFNYITFFLEDNRGCVWVGTNAGVFEITNPSDATDFNMRVRRIKVPRNDGTNYADYLLDSDLITWMALDPAGRKWIATENSGIFLVSETGDKIITQYTSDNSPLPSNMVCTIECDKENNTVYVGTTSGLYSFKSDASPGKEDYSDIYAYPNPVRPEYSGFVNITGLMENSIVKITDAMGSVVYETRSEGGLATWDVCNNSGNRVKSGVYYVYVSQNNSGTTSGAVTKILVIN